MLTTADPFTITNSLKNDWLATVRGRAGVTIDRSFIINMATDADSMAIVSTIISLGHSLNMKVIAEGIEAGEQAALLREMGCDMAQGLYFVKPLPAEAAPEFLAATPT